MPHSRFVDDKGILVTTLSGMVTLKEFGGLQEDLHNYIRDGQLYELVLHSDDFVTPLDGEESVVSANTMKSVLKGVKRAAIAFVTNGDLAYGLCRQLQVRSESKFVQLCVFRTETTARAWLSEMQSAGNA